MSGPYDTQKYDLTHLDRACKSICRVVLGAAQYSFCPWTIDWADVFSPEIKLGAHCEHSPHMGLNSCPVGRVWCGACCKLRAPVGFAGARSGFAEIKNVFVSRPSQEGHRHGNFARVLAPWQRGEFFNKNPMAKREHSPCGIPKSEPLLTDGAG